MTTFYRVDGAKLSYGEYWRMAPDTISFTVSALRKLIRLPIRFSFAVPRPDRLFLIELDELPDAAYSAMSPLIKNAESAGLEWVFAHRLPIPEPHRLGTAAVFLAEDRKAILSIIFSKDRHVQVTHAACLSRFADGTYGITTTMKKMFEPDPSYVVERYPGLKPAALHDRHGEHLERLAERGLVPIPFAAHEVEPTVYAAELRHVDFQIARGVYVPMTNDELDNLQPPDEEW